MSSETENSEFGRCRCCLKEGNHKDITKPYYNAPDCPPEVYREIIKDCFNISLSSNTKLTNLICGSCVDQLREASAFKTMVTESEQTLLREIISNYAQTHLNPELKVNFHRSVTVKLKPEPQPPRDVNFESIVVKVEPQDFGDCDDPPPPIDSEIEYSATSGHDMVGNSFWNPNTFNITNTKSKTNSHNEKKPNINKLLIKREANNQYSCSNTKSLLKSYLQSTPVPRPFVCDTCSYSAITKGQLERHIKRNHLERPYGCDLCSKKFYFKSNYLIHCRIHTGERPYSCEVCNQKFAQSSHLKYHARIHLTERPYACEICGRKFAQESNLHDHNRIHTGEKPFECKMCNKKFARSNTLARHVRTHTDVKPYACEVCKKRFSQTGHLIQHTRVHSGEKPYACDFCDKRFARKGHLTDHFKSHTDIKTYTCPTCNGKFKRQGALSRHIKRHENKPNKCKTLEVDIKQEIVEDEDNKDNLEGETDVEQENLDNFNNECSNTYENDEQENSDVDINEDNLENDDLESGINEPIVEIKEILGD